MRPVLTLTAVLLATAPAAAAPDDARARALYGEIVAPCCWSQPLSVHRSPAAEEVRAAIRQQVEDGWSDRQILDALVTRYGARVLARPPAKGFAWTLYVTPWVVLVGSGLGVSVLVRRFARRHAGAADRTARGPADLEARLDDDLRNLD